MKYYNVPADFKNETIDKYAELNREYRDSKVLETYGQITVGHRIGSGRAYGLIPQVDINALKEYVGYSKEKNIGFNYTLNITCMSNKEFTPAGLNELLDFLNELHKAGVRSLTIALPSLIELVRLKKLDFEIRASTLCSIINANKAVAFKKMGVDKIVVDESINRNFHALKRIRQGFGSNVELITNVICHKDCIYRLFHYNHTSHDIGDNDTNPSMAYYSHRCMMQRSANASNIMKMSWIRPEDIKHYSDIGINYFKIQGRQAVLKGDPVRTVKAYMDEHYDGNLIELLDMFAPTNSFGVYVDNRKLDGFIDPFINIQNFCKNNCLECSYCESFARKSFDYDKVAEVFSTATEFYREYDQYINMAQKAEGSAEGESSRKTLASKIFDDDI